MNGSSYIQGSKPLSKQYTFPKIFTYLNLLQIAEECIRSKVNMVTASYCSDQLGALGDAAKEAGVTIVNEVGLDPGIDHLLAMEAFDEIHSHGGKVESFVSYCGGLPAPECSDNPLRYKFSWSPRGVLMNAMNGAKYLKANQVQYKLEKFFFFCASYLMEFFSGD